MFTYHGTGAVRVDEIILPPRLNFRRLLPDLERHQLHEAAHHLRRTQYSQSLQVAFGPTQIFVVIEIRPQLGILCEELNNPQALAIEPFVHVAATLQEHHLDLSLGCLESKHAADDRSDDSPGNAGRGS